MKKLLLLVVVALGISLVSCGGGKKEEAPVKKEVPENPAAKLSPEEAAQQFASAMMSGDTDKAFVVYHGHGMKKDEAGLAFSNMARGFYMGETDSIRIGKATVSGKKGTVEVFLYSNGVEQEKYRDTWNIVKIKGVWKVDL